MKRFRVTSAALICASLLTLTACGGDDTTTTAGSAPAASVAAPSAAAEPTASAATGSTGGSKDDKWVCAAVKEAGDDMKKGLVDALRAGGEPTPALFKDVLQGLEKKVSALAADSGDSELGAALKDFGAEASKAASAADPATAADNPAFAKAGKDVTAACKPTGVNVVL